MSQTHTQEVLVTIGEEVSDSTLGTGDLEKFPPLQHSPPGRFQRQLRKDLVIAATVATTGYTGTASWTTSFSKRWMPA